LTMGAQMANDCAGASQLPIEEKSVSTT